ncbi:hypothetical protein D3C71_1908360 [compost metagenome]
MEKYILGFLFACKIMNIIHNDYIHRLIKINKIINRIIFQGIHELLAELFAGNINHQFIRHVSFYLISNRLSKMSFTQAYASINHQRIK